MLIDARIETADEEEEEEKVDGFSFSDRYDFFQQLTLFPQE